MAEPSPADRTTVPCCPELGEDCPCDVLDFHYRLTHNTTVQVDDRSQVVPVEVKIHARLERCPDALALGDLVYCTTLLPGEKVRLFTADRRSRFTFDRETKVSYRHEQTSEERFYMASMHNFMSDVTVRDAQSATSKTQGSWDNQAAAAGAFFGLFGGGSVSSGGTYNSESTRTFIRELRAHAASSDRRAVTMTRAASSVSVGEVQSRTHGEGESEDHFEASSRVFSNPNRCRAVTFYFYQLNKTQTTKFTIEAIERRVKDPVDNTLVTNNPPKLTGGVSVIPAAVLATDKERLEIEQIGRSSVVAGQSPSPVAGVAAPATALFAASPILEPLPEPLRRQALLQVDRDLTAAGLLDQAGPEGKVTEETRRQFSFEHCSSLPTPGLLVKGCLDECDICEPALKQEMKLDLERKDLENKLLARQIELLEKSQEYRCCPADSEETAEP